MPTNKACASLSENAASFWLAAFSFVHTYFAPNTSTSEVNAIGHLNFVNDGHAKAMKPIDGKSQELVERRR